MPNWFDIDAATGVAGIYSSTGTDAPLYDPLTYLADTKFNTSLAYGYREPALTYTGTVNLPAVSANVNHELTHTLFAHGRGGIPIIEGAITAGLSRLVRLNGSVPVQTGSVVLGYQFPRMVHLGADATYVYLHEYGSTEENGGWPALTLAWRVDIIQVATGGLTGFDSDPSKFICGPFDSRRRYMTADAPGSNEPMTHGVTFTMSRPAAEQTDWRYSVAGYVMNAGSLTANAAYTLVTP